MIKGIVSRQNLELISPTIVSDTVDYLTAEFSFITSDWDGTTKWAHFSNNGLILDILLVDDKIHESDHLNLSKGEWSVYIHGVKPDSNTRITTEIQKIVVEETGYLHGIEPKKAPLTAIEQLSQKYQTVLDTLDSVMLEIDKIKKHIGIT